MRLMTHTHARGQATVEIMVILPLLLILLSVSFSIFAQQLIVVDSIRAQQSTERSAQIVASSIMEMSRAPIGSKIKFFIPAAIETQTIILGSGLIEARSARSYSSVKIPFTEFSFSNLHDGNFFTIQRDVNGRLDIREVSP